MTTRQIAQGIAQLGRNGDSTLMHVTPHEVAGLQALAQTQGTSLTINPETGLPEAFSLGGFFNSLLPTIAGFAAAGMSGGAMSPMVAGILAGSATGALTNKKDPLMGAVMGGLGGYGGSNLFGAAKGFAPAATPGANTASTAGAAPNAVQQAVSQAGGVMDPLMQQQLSMFTPAGGAAQTAAIGGPEATYGALTANTAPTANTFAPNFNPISGAAQGTGGYQPPSLLASDTSNLSQAVGNVAADPMGFIGQNKMAIGMPVGMAALSGLEPSDIYGDPMKPDNRGAYDPYASLNLDTDTGLRLYAQGGPVSFADGGDALKGGGSDALRGGDSGATQGSGLLPLDVSDINAKYGYSPSATSGAPRNNLGIMGISARPSMPSVQVPMLGLFADNDQIEAARTAYESQLAAAMSGRGGMGSVSNAPQVARGMGTLSGGPMARQSTGMAGLGAMGSTAKSAATAPTAETSLSRLNLNQTYANGGTVQTGGIRDLYGSSDNPSMNPSLSRDGYGLGRLQAMADSGMGYAKGGNVKTSANDYQFFGGGLAAGEKNDKTIVRMDPKSGRMYNNDFSQMYQSNPEAVFAMLRNSLPKSLGGTGAQMRNYLDGSLNLGGSGAMQGGNLNLNTASGLGMAKGGYLDGAGDGMSDSIPATIEGKQPARLADGEFVIPADVVSHLGNGSTKAGSKRLYAMLDKVRHARTGNKKQGKQINPNKFMPV
jgi:hypothetical protein